MIAMTKFEMVRYLKDYSDLQYSMMKHPNIPIFILFSNIMKSKNRFDDNTREYYDRMLRVYMNYCFLKKFSYAEDFLLNRDNFINNEDLDEIILQNTYITDMSDISKKKLLQLIRNVFNHNDSENIDRFKMSVNGRFIEIELLNGPVKIKISFDKVIDAYNNMLKHRKNNLNLSYDIPNNFNINSENLLEELDKIKFIHYYFNEKLSKNIIDQFNQISSTKGLSNEELYQRSDEFNILSSSISKAVKFDLTIEQKKKLESYILRYKKEYSELLDEDINNIMFYFLNKVIPVPLLKDLILDNQIIYCECFMQDTNKCLNSVLNDTRTIYEGNNPFNSLDSFGNEAFELLSSRKKIDNLRFYKDLLDGEMIAGIPIITYIDSVVLHYCNDEIINIKGNNYNREEIRNSFVHGRWFITSDNCIMMYDANPRNIFDYDLKLVGKINIGDFEEWADEYIEKNREKFDVIHRSSL